MAQGGADLSLPPDEDHDERRDRKRYPCVFEGHARPVAMPDGWWPAKVRNVSTKGMMLFLDRRFEIGAVLTVRLNDLVTGGSFTMLVRVMWLKPRNEGGWLHGCALSRELGGEDLQTLVRSYKQKEALLSA